MKMAFFFTRGMSLENWDKLGMLEREIRTYKELASSFDEIYFFSYGKNDSSYSDKLHPNIHIINRPKFLPVVFYSFLMPFIHSDIFKKIDILKTNQMDGSWSAVIAKKFFGGKLVVRCGYEWLSFLEKGNRGMWKIMFAKMAEKFAYKNADKIIITSEDDKDFIVSRFNIQESKVEVIPNYIDIQKFKPLPIEKIEGRVMFLGRFEEQKNLPNLIRGMSGLSAKLVLLGSGSQREEIENLAKEKNVEIEFLGNMPQNEIPTELNKSQVFVLPSLYEGNPKALLEAMACGVACVGAKSPGIENIIADGENGILCGIEPDSIHESLKRVLGDVELRERVGVGARETIVNKFSLEKVLEKEITLYKKLYEKNI